jgi:TetR/AcrR family transcriptional regulator, cholesterol catabolism regulator
MTNETSRRARKKDETRERITRAAMVLFSQRGYEATTVDDIAAQADVAKGTFFNYFSRKEALLDALAEQRVAEVEEVTRDLLAQDSDTRRKLRRFCAEMARRHVSNPELARMAVTRMLTHLHSPIHGVSASLRGFLRSLLEQGQASGELRPDVDPGRAAALIQGVAIGTLFASFCAPAGSFDLDRELQERVSLILDGIAARAESPT